MDKVLVVDDIQDNIAMLSFALEDDGFEVLSALDALTCMAQAKSRAPDVILLDLHMPEIDGLETLRMLKASESTSDIPVIMVSADEDHKNVIDAIDLGAHDYVTKPIEFPVLAARMRSALRLAKALKELEIANIELNKLATEDSLTGCYNRRQYLKLSENEVSKSIRHGREVSVMMIDIDHFKNINDTYGHSVGDQALKEVAACCQNDCRDSDILGRVGGEEFSLCCPDASIEGAYFAAERVRKSCEALKIHSDGHVIQVTLSIGVTQLQSGDTLFSAIKRADSLLYKAKKSGRNVCVADYPELNQNIV